MRSLGTGTTSSSRWGGLWQDGGGSKEEEEEEDGKLEEEERDPVVEALLRMPSSRPLAIPPPGASPFAREPLLFQVLCHLLFSLPPSIIMT